MISALAPSVEAANALAPPLMVPLLWGFKKYQLNTVLTVNQSGISLFIFKPKKLFGGFLLQSDSVPVYFIWLKYISWFYYGNENFYVTQWHEAGACFAVEMKSASTNSLLNEVSHTFQQQLRSFLVCKILYYFFISITVTVLTMFSL